MSVYDIVAIESKTAKPSTINDIVRHLLLTNGGACYSEMEPLLMPPGIAGSRSFDQALAVEVLLKYDRNPSLGGENRLTDIMDAQPQLSRRILWDRIQMVLRRIGFQLKHGRLVGAIEYQPEDTEADNGQPDID